MEVRFGRIRGALAFPFNVLKQSSLLLRGKRCHVLVSTGRRIGVTLPDKDCLLSYSTSGSFERIMQEYKP